MNPSVLEPKPAPTTQPTSQPDLGAAAPALQPKPKPELDATAPTLWAEAYQTEVFKQILKKRAAFFVPALIFFSVLFLALWVMQASLPSIARYQVYGFINVNFLYTMAIFPIVWIMGFLFVQYIRREVYPLEDELNRRFGKGRKHE